MAKLVLGTDINNTGTPALVRDISPERYLEYSVDNNGKLVHDPNSSKIINLDGVKDISSYALAYSYQNNTSLNGKLDLSSLEKITGERCCYDTFDNCSGITEVDLSNVKTISGAYSCYIMFYGCTGLTSVDLSSLKSISAENSCGAMFQNCTSLTNVSLNNLSNIQNGNRSCASMFSGCTSLANVSLDSLVYLYSSGYSSNGICSYMFSGCTSLTNVNFPVLTAINDYYGSMCSYMFSGCTNLTNVNLSKILKIGYDKNSFNYMFNNCTSLTELRFPNLIYSTNGFNNAFSNMLKGVTGCTVHFPADWETAMSTWSNIQNGMGGTNTTILYDLPSVTTVDLNYAKNLLEGDVELVRGLLSGDYYPNVTTLDLSEIETVQCNQFGTICKNNTYIKNIDLTGLKTITGNTSSSYEGAGPFYGAFYGCTGLTGIIDLSSLESISNGYAFREAFKYCTNITGIDLSSLTTATGYGCFYETFQGCTNLVTVDFSSLKIGGRSCFCGAFQNCTSLTTFDLSSLETLSEYGLAYAFKGCTNLTSVDLSGLTTIDDSYFSNAFNRTFDSCTSLTELRFPSLKNVPNNSSFNNMLNGVTGCTVHFPSNLSSMNFNCGGTNTTVLYDLPATE